MNATELCGGARCVRCGCTDMLTLEIDQKNGDGKKGVEGKGIAFYNAIVGGRRSAETIDVRCRVCNIVDLVERTLGTTYEIKQLSSHKTHCDSTMLSVP